MGLSQNVGATWLLLPLATIGTALGYAAITIGGPKQATFGMRMAGLRVETVNGGNDIEQALFPERHQCVLVVVEKRLERLFGFPLRMLRRHCLDAVEREGDLEIDRLFGPQRAVIVKGGDTLFDRREIRRAGRGHARDEVGDGFLHRAFVPGGQGVGLCARRPAAPARECGK